MSVGAALAKRRETLIPLTLWLLCCAILLVQMAPSIGPMAFLDPDDSMRLVQVRDFLAGQGWFDVSQHRVNPPLGGPMHWSRLVDLPIAAVILVAKPLFGQGVAERIAVIAVPLLLLAALCWALLHATRRIAGRVEAHVAVALLLCTLSILIQFRPLRIDHHGWQILMATIALGAAFDPRPRRGGIVAGSALALWLHISSEGLPYAALFGGLLGLRYLWRAEDAPRLLAYAITLAAGSALLLIGTRGWPESLAAHCDAMSPPYLVPLALAALLLPLGHAAARGPWIGRAATLAVAGGAAAAAFATLGRACLAGPFATLDPLVYRYWYLEVLEGRPITDQSLLMQGLILLPSLLGLAGTGWAAWRERHDAGRGAVWLSLLLLILGSLAVAMTVLRGMSAAHIFALPGIAWMLCRLHAVMQAQGRAVTRIIGTVALAALTPLGISTLWAQAVSIPDPEEHGVTEQGALCTRPDRLHVLDSLPPATLFAPLDIGPALLAGTRHSVIGTAHHRNIVGIRAVLAGFMARPDEARRIIGETSARYVLLCPGLNEVRHYRRDRPRGLAAALLKDNPPAWLQPVPLPGLAPLRLYRVAPGEKRIAPPFMQ